MRFVYDSPQKVYDISITKGSEPKEYQPPKQDKKPLLYYNPTTETWEKPILRQWDSIEKHSDGKYYYHKRSGEVVLNGSESWTIGAELFKENCYYFKLAKQSAVSEYAIGGGKHICNKYRALTDGRGDLEGIAISKGNGINTIEILELKTKFTSYDNALSNFKERLSNSNIVIVYQLAQEEVYECTNIDLITYENETNYIVNCGVISPSQIILSEGMGLNLKINEPLRRISNECKDTITYDKSTHMYMVNRNVGESTDGIYPLDSQNSENIGERMELPILFHHKNTDIKINTGNIKPSEIRVAYNDID